MEKINVLHICDKFGVQGSNMHGPARLFSWWLPRFNRDRFNVRLCGLRKQDIATNTLEDRGIELSALGKGKFDPSTLISLIKIIRQEKIHVLHLHGFGSSDFGILSGILTGIPTIVHEHSTFPSIPLYQRAADYVLGRFASKGLAHAEAVKKCMVEDRKISPEKIEVIDLGIPLDAFRKPDLNQIKLSREKWGVPPGVKVVGIVARMGEQKGHKYLLMAAKKVLNSYPNTLFFLVGDGPLWDDLHDLCKKLEIEKNVIFTGYIKDVPSVMSFFDVHVICSIWEGTPIPAFEAMAMGKSIVSTDVDGLGEIFEDGKTALLVPPKDPDALAERIKLILGNQDLANKLSLNAQVESDRYDISHTVRRLESIYEELTNGNKKNHH